eukprot:SAG11_NODE_22152_length_411_cov_0.807692_1_plen_84_part_10
MAILRRIADHRPHLGVGVQTPPAVAAAGDDDQTPTPAAGDDAVPAVGSANRRSIWTTRFPSQLYGGPHTIEWETLCVVRIVNS